MKTIKHNLVILFATIAFIIPNKTWASKSEPEYKKTIKKEFSVGKDAILDVNHKYGKVHINTTAQNEITIEVTIGVDARNQEDANEIMDNIEIIMQKTGAIVLVDTKYKKNFKNNKNNLQVNYVINIPSDITVLADIKFSNFFLGDLKGKCKLELDYSNFTLGNLSYPINEIYAKFSNGTMQTADKLNVLMSYGTLKAEAINELTMTSEFSTIKIEELKKSKVSSKYDSFSIEKVGEIILNASFTAITLKELAKSAVINSKYGAIKLGNISKNFELIDIDSEFAGVKLVFEQESGFNFHLNTEFAGISVPKSVNITQKIKEYNSESLKGSYGNAKNSTVKVSSKHGGIKIVTDADEK